MENMLHCKMEDGLLKKVSKVPNYLFYAVMSGCSTNDIFDVLLSRFPQCDQVCMDPDFFFGGGYVAFKINHATTIRMSLKVTKFSSYACRSTVK